MFHFKAGVERSRGSMTVTTYTQEDTRYSRSRVCVRQTAMENVRYCQMLAHNCTSQTIRVWKWSKLKRDRERIVEKEKIMCLCMIWNRKRWLFYQSLLNITSCCLHWRIRIGVILGQLTGSWIHTTWTHTFIYIQNHSLV